MDVALGARETMRCLAEGCSSRGMRFDSKAVRMRAQPAGDFGSQFDLTRDGRRSHATILAMKPNSKKLGRSATVWSLVWAFAIIATAFPLKGNPAKDWIEAGLIIGALTFVVLKPEKLVCLR
jgi:hypothetical protein